MRVHQTLKQDQLGKHELSDVRLKPPKRRRRTQGHLLAVGSAVQLRGVANIDHLVTTGLYSRLAHPMYAGFLLWIAGWVMAYGAVISLAVGLVATGCVLSWRRLEDVALESRFRENYRLYRRRTWF